MVEEAGRKSIRFFVGGRFPPAFVQHEHPFSKRSTIMCCFSAEKKKSPMSLTAVFLISSSASPVCKFTVWVDDRRPVYSCLWIKLVMAGTLRLSHL